MQDEYGRPLSDDGQWVWDGSAWHPTGLGQAPPEPATAAYEPTQVGPLSGREDYFNRPAPSTRVTPPPPPPTPWWKRPVVIIGALLVLSAVLVTILLLTRDNGNGGTPTPTPSVSVTPSVTPTSASPSPSPTTEAPTTPPPTTAPPTTPPPIQISGGVYDCTQGGESTGLTISISGLTYTTNSGAVGTYKYDATSGAISFTGGDLGPYTGTYNPSGPSMDIQTAGIQLHCAQ
jgi:hypothetical protein